MAEDAARSKRNKKKRESNMTFDVNLNRSSLTEAFSQKLFNKWLINNDILVKVLRSSAMIIGPTKNAISDRNHIIHICTHPNANNLKNLSFM